MLYVPPREHLAPEKEPESSSLSLTEFLEEVQKILSPGKILKANYGYHAGTIIPVRVYWRRGKLRFDIEKYLPKKGVDEEEFQKSIRLIQGKFKDIKIVDDPTVDIATEGVKLATKKTITLSPTPPNPRKSKAKMAKKPPTPNPPTNPIVDPVFGNDPFAGRPILSAAQAGRFKKRALPPEDK